MEGENSGGRRGPQGWIAAVEVHALVPRTDDHFLEMSLSGSDGRREITDRSTEQQRRKGGMDCASRSHTRHGVASWRRSSFFSISPEKEEEKTCRWFRRMTS